MATGTGCSPEQLQFPAVRNRPVQPRFRGGEVSSDGRLVLWRPIDRRMGLTQVLAKGWPDRRHANRIQPRLVSLWPQRFDGLAAG